jgi:hypothetical protein
MRCSHKWMHGKEIMPILELEPLISETKKKERDKAVSQHAMNDLGTRWGEYSESRPGRVLPPGKGPSVPIGQESGRANLSPIGH